jgi:hypothetical protein
VIQVTEYYRDKRDELGCWGKGARLYHRKSARTISYRTAVAVATAVLL